MQPQIQPNQTHQTAAQIIPIDPTPIAQSDSPTAVILAVAILLSILLGGITGLVRVLVVARSGR